MEEEGESVPCAPLRDNTGLGVGAVDKLPQVREYEGGGVRVAFPVPDVL